MTYTFVAVREGRLWGVTCPSLPGVFGVGKTGRAAKRVAADRLADDVDQRLPFPGSGRLPASTLERSRHGFSVGKESDDASILLIECE